MELWLQFGYGMMGHCRDLHADWRDTTIVLSPRDLEPDQLAGFAHELAQAGATVLIDPQFYLPHANHERLVSHDYWPKNYDTAEFWGGQPLEELMRKLVALNEPCEEFIVPGLFASKVNEAWLDPMRRVFDTAAYSKTDGRTRYATVALASEAVSSDEQIDELLEEIHQWPVEGVYLVVEHPNSQYLVDDPSWLANVLDLVSGIRLGRKDVAIGYASHQMLIAASAGATAIAAGNWLNTRSGFDTGRYVEEEDKRAQKRTWYYCPQALSEYKIPFLDIGRRSGVLTALAPAAGFDATSCAMLFSGGQPTGAGFAEGDSFRHYLKALRHQATQATRETFDATLAQHSALLDAADALRSQRSTDRRELGPAATHRIAASAQSPDPRRMAGATESPGAPRKPPPAWFLAAIRSAGCLRIYASPGA